MEFAYTEKYEKEKEQNTDEAYKIKLPRSPINKFQIQSDLEKYVEANSGIGVFDKRKRFAGGGNGSTSSYDQKHTFQINGGILEIVNNKAIILA